MGLISLLSTTAVLLLLGPHLVMTAPASHQALNIRSLGLPPTKRQDSSLTGYFGAFFLGNDPDVYFYLSDGNDAISFSALNGGDPVLVPTVGTGGVRDPAIVQGGGSEAGQKWYIVGTDLDISKTSWDAAQRTGSRGIFVWESTNLVDWTNERLVEVEDETAGMVWAPEAIWDESQSQYMVHWASKFYDESDTGHTGTPTNIKIRRAYTSDFQTFSTPETYIDYAPTDIIDLNILPYAGDPNTVLRFLKDETLKTIFVEYSTGGLAGPWTRPGGDDAYLRSGVEGPASYWDNSAEGEVHLLVDYYTGNGYFPLESTRPQSNSASDWANSSLANFPTGLRHGGVLPINSTLFGGLQAATWG